MEYTIGIDKCHRGIGHCPYDAGRVICVGIAIDFGRSLDGIFAVAVDEDGLDTQGHLCVYDGDVFGNGNAAERCGERSHHADATGGEDVAVAGAYIGVAA